MPVPGLVRRIALLACLAATLPGATREQGGPREEHFELLSGEEPLGLAVVRRTELGQALQLEMELWYTSEELQVLATERSEAGHVEFIWREVRPRAGRTVFVQRELEPTRGELREWGGPTCLRLALRAESAIEFLPGLLERARAGATGRALRFDPLARALEPLELVSVPPGPGEERPGARQVELRRLDGTPLIGLGFEGEALHTMAWGVQGQRARRISPETYLERRAAALASSETTNSAEEARETPAPQGSYGG